ncbi:MarR family transcriptional regulator [Weizmannia acidilactici]|uniref:MarR family transcriptional regulator n=1 Tax=Weizmannia acidilactici TaxID=2607726 RepID=A0A5J4J2E2_9BACI|nr:MarR family transcriptional regulator [Weizmannia acidilactici]GER66227.1 MarR family transcriptional regulator [Weizmannia acidilactici]GER69136.1 MarR family transcriptional regulator [Weizmannia acidilactici]GER72167.1 MarR family transcriptional regulator [Weizmannia acidilactici]
MDLCTNELLRSLAKLNKAILRVATKDAEQHGLTVMQMFALNAIKFHPNMRLNELAESIRLTNSTVSGIVDRLVHHGLVNRIPSVNDRRAIVLCLTDKGEHKLDELMNGNSLLKKKMDAIEKAYGAELKNMLKLHEDMLKILTSEEE